MKRRFFAAILVAVMALTLLPTVAFADIVIPAGATVDSNDDTVSENNGTINTNYSTVRTNNGTVVNNRGEVEGNSSSGTVENNFVNVVGNNGTVVNNFGLVAYSSGTVENNFGGTVWGEVTNNYGGTVHGGSVTNNYHKVTVVGGEHATVTGLTDANNEKWIQDTIDATNPVTVAPAQGYVFASAPTIDPAAKGTLSDNNDGTYSLYGVTGAITLTLQTVLPPSVTAQPQNQSVTEGENATFSVTATGDPAPTYQWQVKTAAADWANIAGATGAAYTVVSTTTDMNGYQYRCVASNGVSPDATSNAATLTVTAQTHTITPTAGANGTITPSDAVMVTEGDDQTFTIAADAGYEIADVLIDGNSEGPVDTYTFTNVTADHTIEATFAEIPTPPPGPGPAPVGHTGGNTGSTYTGNEYPGSFAGGALTVGGPCDHLTSVMVDNAILTQGQDYGVGCGSTVVTFTPAFLATLRDGVHTVRVQFTDGRYVGTFVTPIAGTAAVPIVDVPATGGRLTAAAAFLWLLCGACCLVARTVVRRRRPYN